MDLAKTLVRCVARAFHETKHMLVVDALIIHSALRDDDLAHLLGMQTKELRKLCAKLEEDRLLAVHNRPELREGTTRPLTKTYYFIDYRSTLDGIKYRMYRIGKEIESQIRPTEERKDYRCPRCRSQWTQLEVLDSVGPLGFLCHRCSALLVRDRGGGGGSGGGSGGHEKQSLLNQQLRSMLDLLPQIDETFIPESSFDLALNAAVAVPRSATTNPLLPSVPVTTDRVNGVTTVKGLAQTAAATNLEVSLTSSDEKSAAEQAAIDEQRRRIATQNVLPSWISRSTITGESTGKDDGSGGVSLDLGAKDGDAQEGDEKKTAIKGGEELNAEVAGYYAIIAEEQAQAAAAAAAKGSGHSSAADDDDDEDDDEGEFEDVPVSAPAKAATNGQAIMSGGRRTDESWRKRSLSDVDASNQAAEADMKASKKARVDHSPAKVAAADAEGKDSEEGEDADDDDEADFEDVGV